ncbi:Copia protein [Rhynchospora pubera]|uniref:Copia protein n=1 Tax=Rhynchospora pubera TaxID=906938 RepID=A0AAV8GP35_9POAL|nr:Copia protein [Rhynchospora pubera]
MATPPSNQSPSPISDISSSSSSQQVVLINLPISTKLTTTNYLSWRSQILPLLHGYNLARHIDSPPPEPTIQAAEGRFEVNPEFLQWHRQDQLLLGWIRSSLTEQIQSQVVSCATTLEIWSELQKLLSSNSRSRVMDLKRQIQSANKGNLSCADYLQSLRRLADELASVGSPYPDDELVMAAINGLGSDYLPVVAAVHAASVHSSFSFSDLHTLLLGHEALLKTHSMSPAAFYAGRNGHGRPRAPYTACESKAHLSNMLKNWSCCENLLQKI